MNVTIKKAKATLSAIKLGDVFIPLDNTDGHPRVRIPNGYMILDGVQIFEFGDGSAMPPSTRVEVIGRLTGIEVTP